MLRSLSKKEMNAVAATWNEVMKKGNTGHLDEINWDGLIELGLCQQLGCDPGEVVYEYFADDSYVCHEDVGGCADCVSKYAESLGFLCLSADHFEYFCIGPDVGPCSGKDGYAYCQRYLAREQC